MSPPTPTPTGSAPLSPLIHLIDDDAAVRDSLALLIGTVGLRVQTWSDPQAFIDRFDRQGIGAIVLDVRMPGLGGLQVLEALRTQGADQPVVMFTDDQRPELNPVRETDQKVMRCNRDGKRTIHHCLTIREPDRGVDDLISRGHPFNLFPERGGQCPDRMFRREPVFASSYEQPILSMDIWLMAISAIFSAAPLTMIFTAWFSG